MSSKDDNSTKRNGIYLSDATLGSNNITSIDFDNMLDKLVEETDGIKYTISKKHTNNDRNEQIAEQNVNIITTNEIVHNPVNEPVNSTTYDTMQNTMQNTTHDTIQHTTQNTMQNTIQNDNIIINEESQQNNYNEYIEGTVGGNNTLNIDQKVDLIVLNNGWNDKNERIIISIGENAASYKWMHEKCSMYYKTINRVLGIIMILFSTGLSAETVLPNDPNNIVIDILRRLFTYIITFISVLHNFLKYEQLSEQHMSSASEFSQLYHAIQQQMCMYRRNRTNATEYVADVLKRYDSMVINGPDINNYVISKFKNVFKNADISVPDIADRIQKIEIISEPIENKMNLNIKGVDKGNKKQSNKNSNLNQKDGGNRYGRGGLCNLDEIHSVFQIHGDISDRDIQRANPTELREIRKRFLREMGNYEYARYMEHQPY